MGGDAGSAGGAPGRISGPFPSDFLRASGAPGSQDTTPAIAEPQVPSLGLGSAPNAAGAASSSFQTPLRRFPDPLGAPPAPQASSGPTYTSKTLQKIASESPLGAALAAAASSNPQLAQELKEMYYGRQEPPGDNHGSFLVQIQSLCWMLGIVLDNQRMPPVVHSTIVEFAQSIIASDTAHQLQALRSEVSELRSTLAARPPPPPASATPAKATAAAPRAPAAAPRAPLHQSGLVCLKSWSAASASTSCTCPCPLGGSLGQEPS